MANETHIREVTKKVRLIDANACYWRADEKHAAFYQERAGMYHLRNLLEDCPTVDAVEVVHGRWEEDKPPKHYIFTGVDVIYRCSECNNRFIHDTHYCPNCGAKMDGGNEDA